MSNDIFIVGHGSKSKKGQLQLIQTVEMLSQALPTRRVTFGFLELATPDIALALSAFVDSASKGITVVPLVLLGAGHTKSDIAGAVEMARQKYLEIEFSYGRDLGVSLKLNQAFYENAITSADKNMQDAAILLVGRGSSDPDANSDLFKAARLMSEVYGVENIEACFISLARPSVPEALDRLTHFRPKRILVIPYFLFAGVLVDRIHSQARQWNIDNPTYDLFLANELGASDVLVDIAIERVLEAEGKEVRMSCDRCIYRERTNKFEHAHATPINVSFPHQH